MKAFILFTRIALAACLLGGFASAFAQDSPAGKPPAGGGGGWGGRFGGGGGGGFGGGFRR
jgi:hypothetical protein